MSSWWYRRAKPIGKRKRPGPRALSLPVAVVEVVKGTAERFPWWGYKRIAVICRRQGLSVSNR